MNKVEEQAMVSSKLLRMLEDVANREIPCQVAYRDIQKRLVAARAEGVAEERERIRKAVIEELHDPDWDSDIIPASVLAPTKEEVMQKQMEEQVMEDQEKEDMLAEDMKRHQQQDDRERWARENP